MSLLGYESEYLRLTDHFVNFRISVNEIYDDRCEIVHPHGDGNTGSTEMKRYRLEEAKKLGCDMFYYYGS